MSKTNTGGPAFPQPAGVAADGATFFDGMTLRDYFAAKAIIAYHADGNLSLPEDCASWCYSLADAMMKARDA